MPLSTVKAGGNELYDQALNPDTDLLINKVAPTYFIDWKTPQEFIEAASPREIFFTRTEIEDTARRSQEQNLFTYSCLLPEDGEGRPVEWVCNVSFDAIEDNDIRRQVRDQFGRAAAQYLNRLGKLSHAVSVAIGPGATPPAEGSREEVRDELIVTLQTDAIMLNPDDVRLLDVGEDLFALYAGYWEEISAEAGSAACLELIDFFAHQNFQGGYLYHRYLGAGERDHRPNQYYPYYLTGAGSVFRLRVLDERAAQWCVDRWLGRGLDLPAWAAQKYSQYDRAL
jgi:hypothetical protein